MTNKQHAKRIALLMKKNPLFRFYFEAIDALNQEFLVTMLSIENLTMFREQCKKRDAEFKISISIPSVNGSTIKSETRKSKIVELLRQSIKTDMYSSSLGNCISIVEFFLGQLVTFVLTKYPQKLSCDANGSAKADGKVSLKTILDAKSLDDVIDDLVQKKVVSLFYASPNDYLQYLEKVLSIPVTESVFYNYVEVKATRDLIVHNNKKVNDVYICKAGKYARTNNTSQMIPVNKMYYEKSVCNMKKLIRMIYVEAAKTHLGLMSENELFA